jgi:hypothetical protein
MLISNRTEIVWRLDQLCVAWKGLQVIIPVSPDFIQLRISKPVGVRGNHVRCSEARALGRSVRIPLSGVFLAVTNQNRPESCRALPYAARSRLFSLKYSNVEAHGYLHQVVMNSASVAPKSRTLSVTASTRAVSVRLFCH